MSGVANDPTTVAPRAVTVRVAAEMLAGTNERTVRQLIRAGKLRARAIGNRYIIPMSAIDEYLEGADDPLEHPDSIGRAS